MKFIIYSIISALAIVAAVIAFRFSDKPAQQDTTFSQPANANKEINVKTVDILVARSNIAVGAIIDSSMVDRQPWPENLLLEGFIINDGSGKDNIIGKVARSSIQAQEPFMKIKLANPNDPGFLAASLPVGMRAITIATDVVSGVAGFVFPGDRVDLLFTHDPISNNGGSSGKPSFSEVLASNVRVLAVNLRDVSDQSKTPTASPTSVTLEVSDTMAQQIRLAEKNGTISLSLRSIHDDGSSSPVPTGVTDISSASDSKSMGVVRGPGGAGGKINFEGISGGIHTNQHDSTPVVISGKDGVISSSPPIDAAIPQSIGNK